MQNITGCGLGRNFEIIHHAIDSVFMLKQTLKPTITKSYVVSATEFTAGEATVIGTASDIGMILINWHQTLVSLILVEYQEMKAFYIIYMLIREEAKYIL